jgi:hypothetical protein
MSNTNGSTGAQRRYIAALAKNYTAAQVTKLIKATGTDSARALDERSTLNQRLTHLTKNYASKMITILKDEDKAAIIIQPAPEDAPVLSEEAVAARDELIKLGQFPGDMVTSPEYYPEYTKENILAFYTEFQRRVAAGEPVGPFDFTFHNFVHDRNPKPRRKKRTRNTSNIIPNFTKEQWAAMCGTGDADVP